MSGERASLALAWSGGKDSTLALHRLLRDGRTVSHLISVHEASSERIRFHGVRRALVRAQARALGLTLIEEASGETADETADETGGESGFETAFGRALTRAGKAGCRGIAFGNIHLEDIRDWYEERVRARGLEHVEPLWGDDPARLGPEFVGLGYRARVVSVMLGAGDPTWVGRELNLELLEEVASRPGVDPCGERGEFHSFVYDGPVFLHRVPFSAGELRELEGHRFVDLLPVGS